MGLETVVEDITEKARNRAEEIREEAESEADEIVADAEDEADEIMEEAKEEVEKEIDEAREQTLSSAQLESKKKVSRTRKELLDELKKDVREELAELEDGRREITESLLNDAVDEIDDSSGTVHSSENDEELVKELTEDHDGFSYGGSENIVGGVVVENSTGKVRVTNSFDSVLEKVWSDSISEISSRLLGE
ncbi:MAG: V-type ATP synthase subunit E [Halobacteria archaeon]